MTETSRNKPGKGGRASGNKKETHGFLAEVRVGRSAHRPSRLCVQRHGWSGCFNPDHWFRDSDLFGDHS